MALQIFLARRFVTERAKDCTQHLSNSKRLLKLTDSITPYLSTIKTLLDLKLIYICPQRALSEIKWPGRERIAGILTERKQKQRQP